jgi:hypothetical protein
MSLGDVAVFRDPVTLSELPNPILGRLDFQVTYYSYSRPGFDTSGTAPNAFEPSTWLLDITY